MENFEVHITGSPLVHTVAKRWGHKTIAIDLVGRDRNVMRAEHMTSIILQAEDLYECAKEVKAIADRYRAEGVDIYRVKIESPPYPHYVPIALYAEAHYKTEDCILPISRSQHKSYYICTDRLYQFYSDFEEWKDWHCSKQHEVELCLMDTFPQEDADWFTAFGHQIDVQPMSIVHKFIHAGFEDYIRTPESSAAG